MSDSDCLVPLDPAGLPRTRSLWRHKERGAQVQYQVLYVANQHASRDNYEFPLAVVYRDRELRVWARPLHRFLERCEEVPAQQDLFEEGSGTSFEESGW